MDKRKIVKPTRFIATFDIHVGWERTQVRGDWVVRPTHNAAALKAVFEFAKDFKPHAWILGGDNLNFGPVSHWNQGRPYLTEGFRLKKEYDLFEELVLTPIDELLHPREKGAVPIKIWHDGNHEAWIYQFVSENPGLQGLIEPKEYFGLEKRGWEIYSQGEVSNLGKINFVHGDVVLRRGGGMRPARKLVNDYNRNIRAGHIHTLDSAVQITPVDAKDFHTAKIIPCLATRAPEYIRNSPNQFINGFLFGEVFPDGTFNDHTMVINKDRFIYNGKLYDGRK